MNTHVAGVDLGGTKVEACLLDQNRNLIARERALSEASKGRDHIVHRIMNLFRKVSEGKVLPLREWERREPMYLRMAVILGTGSDAARYWATNYTGGLREEEGRSGTLDF